MKNLTFLLGAILLLSSCSSKKTLFTQQYRNRIASTNKQNVEKLQYYIDRDIELVFRSSSSAENIKGGKVKFKDGIYIYTIEFKKGTPAIAKYDEDRALKVYFEPSKFLYFRNFDGDEHYQIAGRKENRVFEVSYEDKWMRPEKGGNARLLFVENRKLTKEEERRRVKGMKVN